ncbi:MAG TPA: 50S ribosomal protein L11 methyltransferase [Chthoniobacteraceae bacterium]|nr:50S ribosomal protein L11 methyltransferase [Chthoniobacteraceae bacterium]
MLIWRKRVPAGDDEAWSARLLEFMERMAIISLPGGKSARIEAYALSAKEGAALVGRHGGGLRRLNERVFIQKKTSGRGPIRIRGKLLVVDSERERTAARRKFPGTKVLLVPASMAFGTGEHATTASCLRFLADMAARGGAGKWDMLDLGTGSGILALAAKALGARRVDAFDFDPNAVRVAKENAQLNQIAGVHFARRDVLAWTSPRAYDVVAANLFSEVLIQAAPRIARAVKPGGCLIFSGIMRHQESECVAVFRACGFIIKKISRKGKWVTTLAVKAA